MQTSPLIVDVPGPPLSWRRTTSWQGRKLTDADQRVYQSHVRACAMQARARHPNPPKLDARMRVRVYFCAADLRKRDADNAAKTAIDACNRVLWDDDAQVDYLGSERLQSDRTRARLVLVVETSTCLRTVADLEQELGVVLGSVAAPGRATKARRS